MPFAKGQVEVKHTSGLERLNEYLGETEDQIKKLIGFAIDFNEKINRLSKIEKPIKSRIAIKQSRNQGLYSRKSGFKTIKRDSAWQKTANVQCFIRTNEENQDSE